MIVAVTGGKGGPGATTLAVALARAWTQRGNSCALVDMDPWGGDVSAYLACRELDLARGLQPLLRLGGDLERDAIESELQPVSDGLQLLAGLLLEAPESLEGRAPEVIFATQGVAEVVVADLGRAVAGSPALGALDVADGVVVAARPHLQGALAATRALNAIDRAESIVVATAVRRHHAADVVELAQALERPVRHHLPFLPHPDLGATAPRALRRPLARLIDDLSASAELPHDPPSVEAVAVSS